MVDVLQNITFYQRYIKIIKYLPRHEYIDKFNIHGHDLEVRWLALHVAPFGYRAVSRLRTRIKGVVGVGWDGAVSEAGVGVDEWDWQFKTKPNGPLRAREGGA